MKLIKYIIPIFLFPTLMLVVQSCMEKKQKTEITSKQKYTCPMHHQIMQDAPGTCPICGMDLVPVNAGGKVDELTLSDRQIQLANIKTSAINSANFNTSTVLNARITANLDLSETISSRYAGRLERLYVKETGVKIVEGQPLFQIYSEELQTLQQDYLLQEKQAAAFPNEKIYAKLKEASKNKLLLFGYSNSQIENLTLGNKNSLVTVKATSSGIVNEVSVSEGQYVAEGSLIISLTKLNQLWVEADVYPNEASSIKIGTPVKVSINGFPELAQNIKINFISPQLDPSTQLLKVRGVIQNQGKLQPGMQATVLLPKAEISNANALPLDAVIRDEHGAHVWVKTGKNTFASRMVTTGEEDENQIIITAGLEGAKEVVVSGAYLLYSEYILKKGNHAM